jgi:toluene monooxygenase system protein E
MGVTRFERPTYSHLAGRNRVPTIYELSSSALLYYPRHGFSVRTPCDAWYERYQASSPFGPADWEAFSDPAATTYTDYVSRQRDREVALDDALASPVLDRPPSQQWLDQLESVFAPLRYPGHGLMMAAAYVGSMAPGGKIVIAAAFQAADEMRRVHRFAQQLGHYRQSHPGLGDSSRQRWENEDAWRDLRRLIERLLRTYDWGECLAALNLAVKPVFDGVVNRALARAAGDAGDYSLASMLGSVDHDAGWHRDWTRQLVQDCASDASRTALAGWVEAWRPLAEAAVAPLAAAIGVEDRLAEISDGHDEYLRLCGLETP